MGDPFGFAGLCVFECHFGRFNHCSLKIVICVRPSGDVQVSLWMFRCVKRVPPMMRLFCSHSLLTLSPLFVRSPTPCPIMTLSLFLLLHPTPALRSPSKSMTACRGTSSAVNCSEY